MAYGLNKIIIHHTGGSWTPNETDLKHYHFIVTGSGQVKFGKFKPEDNINCKDGKYAEHCGGGNTGAIGVSMAAMLGYGAKSGLIYPIRKQQFESCMNLVAVLCKKYNIPITPETVFTHKEFGDKNPDTSSGGKIDICYLPCYPEIIPENIGDFIREKVKWYLDKN